MRLRNKAGSFTNGRLYGYAEIKFKNGNNFIGEFNAGHMSGNGEYKYQNLESDSSVPDAGIYEGEYKRGKRYGKGKMKWRDGSEFDGYWVKDMRLKGKMKMIDGTVYEGNFKNDLFHGLGTLYLSGNKIYEGIFVKGFAPK